MKHSPMRLVVHTPQSSPVSVVISLEGLVGKHHRVAEIEGEYGYEHDWGRYQRIIRSTRGTAVFK